jgi:hypothetical protein
MRAQALVADPCDVSYEAATGRVQHSSAVTMKITGTI